MPEKDIADVFTTGADNTELNELLYIVIEKRKTKDETKKAAAEATEEHDVAEAQLISVLKTKGLKSFKNEAGVNAIRREPLLRASVNKDNKPELFEWLRETGQGGMIKEEVHHGTLSSFIKELKKEKKNFPSFIKTYEEEKLTIRGA